MSCCISSAVCCALVTASMSGIALGYNYSLAEYIDLKETNVSVYLKRGIFDDEIGDDMDWRRSGHQPVAGHIGENNLRTGPPEDESTSIRSGRRLDDSIYESDDRNKFEGSLMKLTAKAPAPSPPIQTETTVDADTILSKYSMDSLDQMKAIQSLINMRKSGDSRLRISNPKTKATEGFLDERYFPHGPGNPGDIAPGRKFMPMNRPGDYNTPGDSARYAVPGEQINEPAKWRLPNLPPEVFTVGPFGAYDVRPTYPVPVTPRSGPVRPSRPKPIQKPRPTITTPPILERQEPNYPKSIDEEMDTFKDKLLMDKFVSPSFNDEDFLKNMKGRRPNDEDYEEAIKGVPSRKKRQSDEYNISNNIETKIPSLEQLHMKETVNVNSNKNNSLFHHLRRSLNNIMSNEKNSEVTFSPNKLITTEHENNTSTISQSIPNSMSTNIVLRLLKTMTI